jgi:hypothetical protein
MEIRIVDDHPDLLSSIEPPLANRALNFIATVTSTVKVTSYVLDKTIFMKTLSLAAAGQLQCLPSGFTIC